MDPVELIGFAAGSLVALALLPQVMQSWRTKSTKDISILWGTINVAGQILWLVYGVAIESASLATMSTVTLLMALSIFLLKIKYG